MPVNNPPSPEYWSISGGYPSPMSPVNGVSNDFAFRDPGKTVLGVYIGMVIDTWPETNSCLVQSGYETKIKCSYQSTSFAVISGVTTIMSPPVGGMVVFVKTAEDDNGFIISSVTMQARCLPETKPKLAEWGEYNETYREISDPKTFECQDFAPDSSGIIVPRTIPGEVHSYSESSVGWSHGKLYYRVQAGPLASMSFSSIDDLVDVVAHNFQMFSSSFRVRSFCDYDKTNMEVLLGSRLSKFVKGPRQNATIKMMSGWLAAGLSVQSNRPYELGRANSDVWCDELGTVSIKTVSGSWMQKNSWIPVPIKNREEDDPSGNGDKEIADAKAIREGFVISPPEGYHPAAFGCQARDYVAWQTAGPYRLRRFDSYPKDWAPGGVTLGKSDKGLGGGQYASFGGVTKVSGEEAPGGDASEVRPGEAFCGILPDGSVLLRDAWGSSVELRGGKIVITNAKDTEIVSGGRTVIMSGHDVIVKAKESVDINSSKKNIRARSGKHVFVEAAQGGVQITSKGGNYLSTQEPGDKYSSAGIVLKSDSQITSVAPAVSTVAESSISLMGPEDEGGPVILTKGSTSINWAEGGHYIYVGGLSADRKGMTMFTNGAIQSGGFIVAEDSVYTKGSFFGEKDVFAAGSLGVNGFVASASNGPYVGQFEDPLEIPDENEYERYESFGSVVPQIASQGTIGVGRWLFVAAKYSDIKFTYRTSDEYGTDGYVWFESFWQRQYASELSEWDHKNDADEDGEQVYPGKKRLAAADAYVTYKEQNVSEDGTPVNKSDQKKTGGRFDKKKLSAIKF